MSVFAYQSAPLTTDANVIKQNMVDYLEAYMPEGWQMAPGSLLDLALEAVAIQGAQQADVAQQKLDSDFRYFGKLVGIPPIDAIPAQATATFVLQDGAGYTIQGGSSIGIMDSSGVLQAFDLQGDLVVAPAGGTGPFTASAPVVAEVAGAGVNGLAGSAQLINCPPFVTGASITAASLGIDAETDADFLNRLVETIATLRLIPVLGTDFAVLARSIAGVYRAAGVNLLKPGPPYDAGAEATGVDKNVTVAVADINGQPVGSTVRAAVQSYLQSLREQNFVIWVVDPTYKTVDVNAPGVHSWPGWDTTDVHDRIVAAIDAFLNPATAQTNPGGTSARWASDPIIRLAQLYQTIMEVDGVRYVDGATLTMGIHLGAPPASADLDISGGSAIPALPQAGTITVVVTPTT